MKTEILKKLIKEEIRNILREGENEHQNYMFFQNLQTIKRMTEKMLALNPQEVDTLLSNGHGWAVDHISTAADDVGEVGTWLCNELGQKSSNMMNEASDFDGPGLIVVGRTPVDNNAIGDMVDESNYYGVWNSREGYWFFPEESSLLDQLESNLDKEFSARGINARFEAQEESNTISELKSSKVFKRLKR